MHREILEIYSVQVVSKHPCFGTVSDSCVVAQIIPIAVSTEVNELDEELEDLRLEALERDLDPLVFHKAASALEVT